MLLFCLKIVVSKQDNGRLKLAEKEIVTASMDGKFYALRDMLPCECSSGSWCSERKYSYMPMHGANSNR